jgi:glucose dehydrogenase
MDAIYIGIQGSVLALDPSTGIELWQTDLRGREFVNVTVQGGMIVAATKGEVFALETGTGAILWRNKLKGLGMGFVTIAGAAQAPPMARRKEQNDGSTAAATAAG